MPATLGTMKLTDGQRPGAGQHHSNRQRRAAPRDADALRSARRAGLLGAALVLGSMALPGTTASAAVTGGQHSRLALSDEAYLWAVAVMSARNAWAVGADLVAPDTQFSAPLL